MATRLEERTERIHAAFDVAHAIDSGSSSDAHAEAERLVAAKSLSIGQRHSMPGGAPLVTIIKTSLHVPAAIWAFRLSCADEGGHVVFETIAGLCDRRTAYALDAEVERIAAGHHEHVLAATSAAIGSWLGLATRREEAIAGALRESHARLSAVLLQPGLFDRRAERAAAAQASRVDEAVEKSRARLNALARSRRLRLDERAVVFGVAFRS